MLTRTLRPLARRAFPPHYSHLRTFTTTTVHHHSSPPSCNPPSTPESHAPNTPLNPHLTNTTSTLHPNHPSVGVHTAPPEFLSTVSPTFNPLDSQPSHTAHLTGNTQDGLGNLSPQTSTTPAQPRNRNHTPTEILTHLRSTFHIPPLPRSDEDLPTLRSRLQYQSRKRGILETDLLLSTFADKYLPTMSRNQLLEYDKFLDENDWEIYYWCTQQPPTTSEEYAEGGSEKLATSSAAGVNPPPEKMNTNTAASHAPPHTDPTNPTASENTTLTSFLTTDANPSSSSSPTPTDSSQQQNLFAAGMDTTGAGEWAQTVGRRKEPYRHPPERWITSEILMMIRRHVNERKAGRGMKGEEGEKEGEGREGGSGLGQMPPVRHFEGRAVVVE